MQFKLWLEERELFSHLKKQLLDEILASLDPNQDANHVKATRLSSYKDRDSIYAGPNQVIRIFDNNPKIWELMNKAFPSEVNKANAIRNWLKSSGPTDTVGDLFQQIGIAGNPIVLNKQMKSPLEKSGGKPKSPPIKQAQQPVQGQVPMPQPQMQASPMMGM